MMDEEFENLSISSSEEWAILDENSENNQGITDKFCSVCGVELDQLVYKRNCPLCLVCYSCYQNYPSTTYALNCEHTNKRMRGLQQTPYNSAGSSFSENDLLICQPPLEKNGSEQTNVHGDNVMAMNGNGHTKMIDKEEEDFPLEGATLPVSSSPRLIPFGFDAPPSDVPATCCRSSLSWSDCGGPLSGSSPDSDRQEEVVVPTGGSDTRPADDLSARLSGFEMASPAPPLPAYSYVRCAPKSVATMTCGGRSAVAGGSPPNATGLFALGSLGVLSRSPLPLPSPPSPSNHSFTYSGSPINSAAQFLKSVVKHSATTLNNFDLLPMHPWDGILSETGSSSSVKSEAIPLSSCLQTELRPTQPSTVSTTQMAADSLLLSVKRHTLTDDKLRTLVAPKTIPKCVFEASTYNIR